MQVDKKVEELTLLLMYLTSWEENNYYENNEGKIENGALLERL